MYTAYWRLHCRPFEPILDERFFYPGTVHRVALAKLRWLLDQRREAALVAGSFGIGKTLLVKMLRRHLGEDVQPVVHVVFPPQSPTALLNAIAGELEANGRVSSTGMPSLQHVPGRVNHQPAAAWPAASPDRQDAWQRLASLLSANARRQRHVLVVIDDAHLIQDVAMLETLRLLLNIEVDGRGALALLLVGQPPLLSALRRLPSLESRLGVTCLLRPLGEQETAEYITHRLESAGAQRALFRPDALAAVHALSSGVPRLINRLCDLALLLGYSEEAMLITPAHVELVGQQLTVQTA